MPMTPEQELTLIIQAKDLLAKAWDVLYLLECQANEGDDYKKKYYRMNMDINQIDVDLIDRRDEVLKNVNITIPRRREEIINHVNNPEE